MVNPAQLPYNPGCTPARDLGSSPSHFGAPSQLAVSPDGRWFATGLGKDVYTWKQPVTWVLSTEVALEIGFLGICPGLPRKNVANEERFGLFVWDGTRIRKRYHVMIASWGSGV